MAAVESFNHIILHEGPKELVLFLLQLEKEDIIPVRHQLLSLRKELQEARQLDERHWGSLETAEQAVMLFLSGVAVYSRKEAMLKWFQLPWSFRGKNLDENTQSLLVIVERYKPLWLAEWIKRTDIWSSLTYWILRELERRQLVEYQASVWTQKLAHILFYPSSTKNYEPVVVQLLQNDEIALRRDLPLLFDFDTTVDTIFSTGVDHQLKWLNIITHLTTTNHLDRADILTRCLLALRRDFRRPLLTWFRELFLALKPTFTERLARQAELTELLAHPQALVVNFALDQLKDMHPETGFNLAPLLLSAESLLARPDLKTGLRTLVAGLAKLPYRAPAHAPAVASLLTSALAHPDAAVQTRAAKGLAELLSAKKPLLAATETAATLAALAPQAELLGAAARTALAPWLAAPVEATATLATYAPIGQFVPDISPATAIAPVADWHELLFLTGQVLRHDAPLTQERWLDGLLRLHGQLPAGYAAQLQPYLVHVLPALKKASAAEASALLTGPIALRGHEGLVLALLLGWGSGFATPRVASVQLSPHTAAQPLLALEQQRYLLVENQLRTGVALPLLSTPTHQPHWLAPSTLVNSLLAYQAAATAPTAADLALALARTAHAHPAEAAEALRLLPQLADTGLRELLTWFFGPAGQPLPALAPAAGRAPAGLATALPEALPELWAVAARTKAPAGTFPTLAASLGYDHAGVTRPLPTSCEPVPRENRYPDPSQPGQEAVYRFVELSWRSGATAPAPSLLLLYAPPAVPDGSYSWEANWLLIADLPHLFALLPNYPAPLYAEVLRCAAWADNLESSERDLLLRALHSLLGPGPVLDTAATAVLASGLLHHSPPGRSLAQEVLLQAVAHGRLLPAALGQVLGQQLASGYAPAARLAANLLPLKGIDNPTDDALGQTLSALLPGLPATPPRNLGKLLATFADLLARTRRPLPASLRPNLRAWQKTASLKAVVNPLLALPE